MRFVLLVPLVLGMTGLANADHCQQVQQVVQAITYQPVVQTVAVPIYAAVYQPQLINGAGTQSQTLSNEELLKQILLELQALNAKMDRIGGNAEPINDKLSALDVMRTKCAACHKTPAEKGLGFVLFDGQNNLVGLNPKDRQRVFNRVSRNTMPPPETGIKLTEADKKAIISLVK